MKTRNPWSPSFSSSYPSSLRGKSQIKSAPRISYISRSSPALANFRLLRLKLFQRRVAGIREIPAVPAVHFSRNEVTVTRMFETTQLSVIEPVSRKGKGRGLSAKLKGRGSDTFPGAPISPRSWLTTVPASPRLRSSVCTLQRVPQAFARRSTLPAPRTPFHCPRSRKKRLPLPTSTVT